MLQRAPANNRTTLRPDLSNRGLRLLVAALVVMITTFVLAKSHLPLGLQRPGFLQPAAALGALLLLVPFLFSLVNDWPQQDPQYPGIRKEAVFIPIGWGASQPHHLWRSVSFLTDASQRDPASDHSNLQTFLCRIWPATP